MKVSGVVKGSDLPRSLVEIDPYYSVMDGLAHVDLKRASHSALFQLRESDYCLERSIPCLVMVEGNLGKIERTWHEPWCVRVP